MATGLLSRSGINDSKNRLKSINQVQEFHYKLQSDFTQNVI
jgi:hypothetical protein